MHLNNDKDNNNWNLPWFFHYIMYGMDPFKLENIKNINILMVL